MLTSTTTLTAQMLCVFTPFPIDGVHYVLRNDHTRLSQSCRLMHSHAVHEYFAKHSGWRPCALELQNDERTLGLEGGAGRALDMFSNGGRNYNSSGNKFTGTHDANEFRIPMISKHFHSENRAEILTGIGSKGIAPSKEIVNLPPASSSE